MYQAEIHRIAEQSRLLKIKASQSNKMRLIINE
jgi:hypothetical protein